MTSLFRIRLTAIAAVILTTALLAGCGSATSAQTSSTVTSSGATSTSLSSSPAPARQAGGSTGGSAYLAAMKACAPHTADQALIECLRRHGAATTGP